MGNRYNDGCGDADWCAVGVSSESIQDVVSLAWWGDYERVGESYSVSAVEGALIALAECKRLGCRLHKDMDDARCFFRELIDEADAEDASWERERANPTCCDHFCRRCVG